MTDAQINQAIAKACGIVGKSGEIYKTPNGWVVDCPDYCSDLNAMHEAEKVMTIPQEKDYFANLEEIVGDLMWTRSAPKSHRATARQRAEAFLLTLGKWSATDKDSLLVQPTTEQSSVDQDVGWPPPGTRILRMNTDGKWEEVKW